MANEMREVYERYTRDVRYGTYKTVAATIAAFPSSPTVMLGHNKDDCLENLFTNVAHKAHYDNLKGMTEISTQDGIRFVRPLLSHSTEDIKSTLRALNIPHLPNSTPPWSQRGQIRASVVPVLDKWDPRFTGGFFKLSETVTSLYRILDHQVTSFCKQHAAQGYVTLDDADAIDTTNTLFWKEVITRISPNHQVPKESALENMSARLQAFKKQSTHKTTKIVVSKTIIVHAKRQDSKIDITITNVPPSQNAEHPPPPCLH
jgi:tRNA(Ile)-lysidine synthase TilS/MesJ